MSLHTVLFEIIDGVGRLDLKPPGRLNGLATRMPHEEAEVLGSLGGHGFRGTSWLRPATC